MSANKDKGTKWETDLVKFLTGYGIPARRVAQEGFNDSGDLHGLSPFIGQAKNWKSWEAAIREGLDGAERQKVNAGEPYGVAFVKRARKGTGEGYAVMTVATFAGLLVRLRSAEEGLRASDPAAFEGHAARSLKDDEAPFPKG